jgi:hypothetical protein
VRARKWRKLRSVGRLRSVKAHTLFETSIIVAQLRLFDLGEVLGEEGWMKVLSSWTSMRPVSHDVPTSCSRFCSPTRKPPSDYAGRYFVTTL